MKDTFDEDEVFGEMYVHIAWSTRDQKPLLSPFAQYLYQYICDLALTCECHVVDGRVFSDHVQLVVKFSPDISFANLITNFKVATSMLIRTQVAGMKDFEWQKSDFGFTVSSEEACSTIDHNAKTFSIAVCELLNQNDIQYDLKDVLE